MNLPSRREDNPFIAPSSQYACAVPDCHEHGVWSPMLNGPTWYCRLHAGLPQPTRRVRLTPAQSAGLMTRIWTEPEADLEAAAERAAIQAESNA